MFHTIRIRNLFQIVGNTYLLIGEHKPISYEELSKEVAAKVRLYRTKKLSLQGGMGLVSFNWAHPHDFSRDFGAGGISPHVTQRHYENH